MRRKPNLFIVGAMKSGTTSLHRYLSLHPDIFMSDFKEPNFFVEELNRDRGLDWYLDLFSSATNETYLGESSTDYTKLPLYSGVAEKIYDFCPQARILYIMRDPVERAISHYWWEMKWTIEGRDMVTVFKKSPDIVSCSYYAMQLRPYFELFGRQQVMVLTLEELSCKPLEVLRSLFEWLDVNPDFEPHNIHQKYNSSKNSLKKITGLSYLSHFKGSPLWIFLKKYLPREFVFKILSPFYIDVDESEEERRKAIAYLRPICQEQTRELELLLNRKFPEWQTTFPIQADDSAQDKALIL